MVNCKITPDQQYDHARTRAAVVAAAAEGRDGDKDQPHREIWALRECLFRLRQANRRTNESLDFDQVLQGWGQKNSGDLHHAPHRRRAPAQAE